MIRLQDLSIQQGDFALSGITASIESGAYAVIMGRSGCGKTTILEAICGLRPIQSGSITIDERDVTGLPPGERLVGYVPQDRALFPSLSVREQLAFALVIRKVENSLIAKRVDELAEMLTISHLLDRYPEGLSGGEAQRIALGRALAMSPSVLCLDEPLSALDEELHEEMCALLSAVHKETGVTVVHITHSRQEANRLATQRFSMVKGCLTLDE